MGATTVKGVPSRRQFSIPSERIPWVMWTIAPGAGSGAPSTSGLQTDSSAASIALCSAIVQLRESDLVDGYGVDQGFDMRIVHSHSPLEVP